MPLGFRIRAWGVVVEFVDGVSDELVSGIWNNTNSSNTNAKKIERLTEKVINFPEFLKQKIF